ncbi:hypothetical protein lerEdw1_019241 [Lerista edwardsae]|nr:hypothetical protein lerEdw1_019241 [Lerista edwardsae]
MSTSTVLCQKLSSECILKLLLPSILKQTTDISLPPEDLDSSGDDDDSFSGSGAGSLPDHPVDASTFSLRESTNSSVHVVQVDLKDDQSEAGTDSPREDPEMVSVLPTSDQVTEKLAVAEDESNSFTEQVTTRPTVVTTRISTMHHTSTVRITTLQDSSTAEVVEPKVHHETYHDATIIEKDVPTSGVAPTSERSLDAVSFSTTSPVPHKDVSSLPEVLTPEDGSGDVGDFIFGAPEENIVKPKEFEPENRAVDTGAKDEKSAAAQGIMDRKEVLGGEKGKCVPHAASFNLILGQHLRSGRGEEEASHCFYGLKKGVIAGGLVGLLFAGVLVGFMLYRMKKKDEGSYSLDEPKQSNGGYQKPHKQEEFYA